MLYWLTGTANSSSRIYYENMRAWAMPENSGVPTGVAVFAEDVSIRGYAEEANTIVHWSEFDRGGHFAALEVPDLLVEDIRACFAKIR
jgi:epoxide hydrolase